MIDEKLLENLTASVHRIRTDPTYRDMQEGRAMDRNIAVTILDDYAKSRGFSNLQHMDRHLAPPAVATGGFVDRLNQGRRSIDQEDAMRSGGTL